MAVAYDTAVQAQLNPGNSSIGINITVAAGSNRALVLAVGVEDRTNGVITGVSGAGATWTKLSSSNGNGTLMRGEIWVGVAPNTGAQTVTVTYTGNLGGPAGHIVWSLNGVDQTTPLAGYTTTLSGDQVITITSGDMALSGDFDGSDVRTVSGCTSSTDVSNFSNLGVAGAHCSGSPTSTFTWSVFGAESIAVGCQVNQVAATSPAIGSYRGSAFHPGRGVLRAARFYRTPRSLELPLTRFVQSAGNSTGAATQSTIAVTLNGVKAGNALLVMVSFGATTDVNDTVTDGGDTFTPVDVVFDTVNGQALKTWYALNSLGGNLTISAHFTAPEAFLLIIVHEVSGLAALDQHAMALQTSPGTGTDGITSGSVTTTANGEYIFGGTTDTAGGITDTKGTGYNSRTLMNVASQQQGLSEDQIQGTAGPIAATFTQTANHRAITAIMTFTPGVNASTPVTDVPVAESIVVGLSEAQEVAVTLDAAESLVIGTTEDQAVAVTFDSAEAVVIGLAEFGDIFIAFDAPDSVALVVTEAADSMAFLDAVDALAIGISELAETAVALDAVDALSIGLTEAQAIDVVTDATDAPGIIVAEAQTIDVVTDAVDAVALVATENADSAVVLEAFETLAIVATEDQAVAVALDAADAIAIVVSEDQATSVVTDAADSLGIIVAEDQLTDVVFDAADSVAIAVLEFAESAVIVDTTPIDVVDALAIVVSEGQLIDVVFDAPDALAIGLVELAETAVALDAAESLTLGLGEAFATAVTTEPADAVGIVVDESTLTDVTLDAQDAVAIIVTEVGVVDDLANRVDLFATESLTVAVTEATDLAIVDLPPGVPAPAPASPYGMSWVPLYDWRDLALRDEEARRRRRRQTDDEQPATPAKAPELVPPIVVRLDEHWDRWLAALPKSIDEPTTAAQLVEQEMEIGASDAPALRVVEGCSLAVDVALGEQNPVVVTENAAVVVVHDAIREHDKEVMTLWAART